MRFLLCLSILTLLCSEARADSKAEARRYFTRGMAYIDSGRYRDGIEQLEKAYEIRPHRNVLFNIGRAYASLGKVSKAIEYFESYLAENPPDRERVESTLKELRLRQRLRGLVNRGMRAIRNKRYDEGIGYLRQAYRQRPHKNILFNIARAQEDAGDYEAAIASYQEYLRSAPKDSARVKKRIRKMERAIKKRDQPEVAVRRKPDRRRRRTAPPPPPPPPPPSGTQPSPKGLDAAALDRIADLIIEKLKAEGAFSPPPPVVTNPEPDPQPEPPIVADVAPPSTSTISIVGSDVQLEAKGGEVYQDVVVTASRREQSPLDSPNAVTILTEEDIRLSGARTLPDLLRRVPGVDVMQMSYSDYNVSVRGFNRRVANKILVLIDGRTAYQDFIGGMLWRGMMIDLNDIDRIEVVRGPGSAIYGAYAYTGMVNIITKRPEQLKGSVATVSAGNGSRLEASYQYGERIGNVGVRLSLGYDRGNKFELEFDPARVDYTTTIEDVNESLDMFRIDGEAEYNLPPGFGRAYVGAGARTGFSELYGVAALRNQAIKGNEVNLRGGYDSELLSVRAFWNRLDTTSTPQFFRTGLPDLGSRVRSDLVSVEPVFRPEFELLGKHQLVIGGEYRHKRIDWDYIVGPQTEDHFAIFLQESYTPIDLFTAIFSARLDLHPLIGPLFSPRIAAIFKPSPEQAIRISLGTAFRQPTMAETYLDLSASAQPAGVAITLVGNRDLDPERIETVDIGYRWTPDFGDFELVGFFNRVSNLITRTPLAPTGTDQEFREDLGAFVGAQSFYVNEERKYLALGSELALRTYPIDGLDVGGSYAFQYIFEQDGGARYTDSPMHKVSLWGYFRTKFGLDLGASFHFVSDQNWIEPTYDPTNPSGFLNCPDNVDCRVPSSVIVIGRIGYRLFEDQLELGVSGTNLLDFGDNRHREHPFGNQLEARIVGTVTGRF